MCKTQTSSALVCNKPVMVLTTVANPIWIGRRHYKVARVTVLALAAAFIFSVCTLSSAFATAGETEFEFEVRPARPKSEHGVLLPIALLVLTLIPFISTVVIIAGYKYISKLAQKLEKLEASNKSRAFKIEAEPRTVESLQAQLEAAEEKREAQFQEYAVKVQAKLQEKLQEKEDENSQIVKVLKKQSEDALKAKDAELVALATASKEALKQQKDECDSLVQKVTALQQDDGDDNENLREEIVQLHAQMESQEAEAEAQLAKLTYDLSHSSYQLAQAKDGLNAGVSVSPPRDLSPCNDVRARCADGSPRLAPAKDRQMMERRKSYSALGAPNQTIVTFEVRHDAPKEGEEVCVVGNRDQLGMWDPANGLRLTTTAETFPIWRADVELGASNEFVEYKLAHRTADKQVIWEFNEGNRQFSLDGETERTVQLAFGERKLVSYIGWSPRNGMT